MRTTINISIIVYLVPGSTNSNTVSRFGAHISEKSEINVCLWSLCVVLCGGVGFWCFLSFSNMICMCIIIQQYSVIGTLVNCLVC